MLAAPRMDLILIGVYTPRIARIYDLPAVDFSFTTVIIKFYCG